MNMPDVVRTGSYSTTYWQLTEWTGYGSHFDSLSDATAEAGKRIQEHRERNLERNMFVPLSITIDERLKDSAGDRVVRRYTLRQEGDSHA